MLKDPCTKMTIRFLIYMTMELTISSCMRQGHDSVSITIQSQFPLLGYTTKKQITATTKSKQTTSK